MCKNGKHNLIIVYSHQNNYGECPTVRWCADCGGVVADVDIDGRTHPGYIRKMQFPKSAYKNKG